MTVLRYRASCLPPRLPGSIMSCAFYCIYQNTESFVTAQRTAGQTTLLGHVCHHLVQSAATLVLHNQQGCPEAAVMTPSHSLNGPGSSSHSRARKREERSRSRSRVCFSAGNEGREALTLLTWTVTAALPNQPFSAIRTVPELLSNPMAYHGIHLVGPSSFVKLAR